VNQYGGKIMAEGGTVSPPVKLWEERRSEEHDVRERKDGSTSTYRELRQR